MRFNELQGELNIASRNVKRMLAKRHVESVVAIKRRADDIEGAGDKIRQNTQIGAKDNEKS